MGLKAKDLSELKTIASRFGFSNIRFNALCKTYEFLRDDERVLFKDLLSRFLYIPLTDYAKELAKATTDFLADNNSKSLIIYSGLSNKDWGKSKSNYLISYQFKGSNLKYEVDWRDRKLKVVDNVKGLLKASAAKDSTLVLVDDFVGSGETIEKAFYYLLFRLGAKHKNIHKFAVVCIAAMKSAIERLDKSGIKVYCSHVLDKGISNHYTGDDKATAIRLMNDIETRMKIPEGQRFGYRQSEALICLERCPNNTFPLFRYGQNAIFSRY